MADVTVPTKLTDPYLRPDTVKAEIVEFNGVSLPPIFTGVEPGKGFNGEPVDYNVQVISIDRTKIDAVLSAIKDLHPELHLPLTIVSEFMRHLDALQSEARFGLACAKSWINGDTQDAVSARANLEGVAKMLGRANDAHRLYLKC